ncbi:ABC transporter substrate-binding protein [Paeniglutamicibacter psychrophenolicus]|uniref:ABC transporter substrate-binding protein n=1 Tax=Paeniglutamicibacter psychrophenolicus TaxID=257454 RepID=UPI00277F75E9|nr:ABC transporter substrate-binding protein [Paeniglutamicibacter psychrophenolicus]MDQ0092458.1 peptide/nickel transport system substrate-binding protein [Paeniglutamicibacter psychrophenolicus]
MQAILTARRGRRGARLAAVLAALLMLAACSAGSTGGAPADKDKLVVALTGEPVNLDFTTTAGAAIPQAMMANVYEGLVTLDQTGAIRPLLATQWETSNMNKSYTFTLVEGATFSNGAAFDAEDVKFSIERVKSAAWLNGLKSKMDDVEEVVVNSPTSVTVNLARPSQAWLYSMTTLVGAMFDPSGVDDLANNPVGTGPYKLASWARGESINLEARPDYWGAAPGIKDVSLRYFADAIATTNALSSGDVDVIYNMQAPELLSSFESNPAYQVIEGTSNGEVILSMNNKAKPFNDKRVRQAVLYAIDRKTVRDTAWNGLGTLVGGPVPPTDPYYEDLNDRYPFDPAKARALLKEAGAQDLKITFTVPTRPYATAVSEIVQSQLRDVGIDAKIQSAEFPAVWLDTVFTRHDYQMSVILAVEARDLLTMFNNPNYYIGYDNSKIKDEAAAADASDEATYVEGMKNVVRTIVEDAPVDTLFIFPNISVAKAGISGLGANSVTEALNLAPIAWS